MRWVTMTWSDLARRAILGCLCGLLLLAVCIVGCRRGELGLSLYPLVQAKAYTVTARPEGVDGLTFPRAPEAVTVEVDHERRPAVLAAAAPWRWRGRVPPDAVLHIGVQALPAAWQAVHALEAVVTVHDEEDGREREVLAVARIRRRDPPCWLDVGADLGRYAGRRVTIEFAASLCGLPAAYRDANLVAWGPVTLQSAGRQRTRRASRPNILFILVDTLRADHTTPYGYKVHDTTPEVQRWLADRGTVVEHAYSQAPWTLPSVVSLLTGRHPGELLGADLAAFGIPDAVQPLAERLQALGYQTGGFVANPLLHAGAGFERGFRTFFAPPAEVEWLRKHADDLNRHAVPWLRAYQDQDRPFFAYVHYVDPHDPYENPDMIGGRAQFMPDYTGTIGSDWIHGIYAGKLQLSDPARDIPYIRALYDGEVHYVDRYVGELLAALDPEVLADTLVVLTADHGEELYDHGGWKHGQSLYEEQIHVPLVVRWDGHVPAGKRLGGTVRLLDLAPTLVDAAGGKADPGWQGVDLLPALTGREPPPRRPAFAEGMSGGPLRAAAVLDGRKLILFNREEPFHPTDELQEHLWRVDLARMQRTELYDLASDPGEHHNASTVDPPLDQVIDRQLGRELPGLWLVPAALPAGGRLSGSIVCARAPQGWAPYFLGPGDRVELAGTRLRFDLAGEGAGPAGDLEKGVRLLGDCGGISVVEASLDGRPLAPGDVRIGAGAAPWSGGPIAAAALRSPSWPNDRPADRAAATARLRLWALDESGAVERRRTVDPETERRLRTLGYIH